MAQIRNRVSGRSELHQKRMEYKLGKYTFQSAAQLAAAKRDLQKIGSLHKVGSTPVEIARNHQKQIVQSGMKFETVVGKDFITNLNRTLAGGTAGSGRKSKAAGTKSNQKGRNSRNNKKDREPVSGSKAAFKYGTMAALLMVLAVVGYVLYANIMQDVNSRKNMKKLQGITGSAQTMAAAETADIGLDENGNPVALDSDGNPILDDATGGTDGTGGRSSFQPLTNGLGILPQLNALREQNPDLVGWLKIPGTIIDYPVMYTEGDNNYYLSHDFYGNKDKNGMLVLDKRCPGDASGDNILIHGHNMKSGYMFGSLNQYESYDFYNGHPFLYFDTMTEEKIYTIFAVFISSVYDSNAGDFDYYNYITIDSREAFNTYISSVKQQSLYDTGILATYGDELITLSTCDYSRQNGRLVVVAKRAKTK